MARAKTISGIDCDADAVSAISRVLIARLNEMCSLRGRALDSTDFEGVHDMRVSSRRLRGALSDFAPYLSKRDLSAAFKQITRIADALGQVRDQDVAIAGLEKLAAQAPEEAATSLKDFIKARVSIRNQARRELQKLLRQSELKQLHTDFKEDLDAAIKKSQLRTARSKEKEIGPITYHSMARSIVTGRLKDLEKLSDGFYHPLKAKPLHKLRIAAKHLRYALELFEQCFGPGTAVFAKKIAALQTSLGELHDSDIWIEAFGEQLKIATREVKKSRVAGSLWLLSHFVKLHSKHLRGALGRWEEWEVSDSSNQLRMLINRSMSSPTAQSAENPAPAKTEESKTLQPSQDRLTM